MSYVQIFPPKFTSLLKAPKYYMWYLMRHLQKLIKILCVKSKHIKHWPLENRIIYGVLALLEALYLHFHRKVLGWQSVLWRMGIFWFLWGWCPHGVHACFLQEIMWSLWQWWGWFRTYNQNILNCHFISSYNCHPICR